MRYHPGIVKPLTIMPNIPPRTIRDLLADAATGLAAVSENPRLDAELLLSQALDRPRSHLRTWPENTPDADQLARFDALLARRSRGEPMAYIQGAREFWSLNLRVSPDTLIPRPDTEILVEAALEKIPRSAPCRVLDLGTGTGAIALALKQERPLAEVHASDASRAALEIARDNAKTLKLDLRFVEGDWWAPFEGRQFDVVVSNPPYIADTDAHLVRGDLRFEPRAALASGPDGLTDIRRLIADAPRFIAPGGWLLLEHGFEQADAVRALLADAGFEHPDCRKDLAGHVRASLAQRSLAGTPPESTGAGKNR
ncbi:MAG TPA: peptide chain release factor N(5)-glutamine methyltransferase [Gammaproteobacteria bacterium]